MFRKVLTGIAVAIIFLVLVWMMFLRFNGDPNYRLKKIAVPVKEGKTVEVSDIYNSVLPVSGRTRMYEFTPSETAEYEFTLNDLSSDEDVILSMVVMDENMSEYAAVSSDDAIGNDNSDQTAEKDGKSLSCRVSLQKNSTCYIGIDTLSAENRNRYHWKYSFTVSRAPEEEKPAEISVDQKVSVSLKADEKKSLLFIPEATGYYKFETEIVSGSRSGYAGIDSVTLDNNEAEEVTDGLCCLEAGNEYYVWVEAYDIKKTAKADVSCRRIGSAAFGDAAEVRIAEESVIEYNAAEDGIFVIYSASDGDPDICVYDADGFPMRNDADSGAELSENGHDFAVVIDASAGDVYRLFVSGRFNECKVILARYTGDGTTLGPDDIEAIGAASAEPAEESIETKKDETAVPDQNGSEGEVL